MRTRGFRHPGFTLIELLVVISIISLLTTILLPSLSHAKRFAKHVACEANLKGIGLGWRMYLDDHEAWIPIAPNLPEDKNDPTSLVRGMEKYVEGDDHWRCPGDDQGYFEKEGISYEYVASYGLQFLESAGVQGAAAQIRNFLDANERLLPVIADAAAFHPTRKIPDNKIALFHDGHVDDGELSEDYYDDIDSEDIQKP